MGIALGIGSTVGLGDGSGIGLEGRLDRCHATSASVSTSKREAYLAKTMVKNTRLAVNTAVAIANHLIHRESSMRKLCGDGL
jgi:hypothetical protein